MLKIKGVELSHDGKKKHLNNVTTEIPKGKITTIIGPNGCGKSTLLSVISKTAKPDRGAVFLEEKDIIQYDAKAFARKLAIVYQTNLTPEALTVEKLVGFGRVPHQRMFQRPSAEDLEVIEWALKSTNLLEKRENDLNALSGGERQRVWIAMALAQKTPILCLDEPTTYLDIYYQIELLDLIKKLNEENQISIVMVLHDMNQAIRYSDHIIMMKNGEVLAEGAPKKVVTKENVKDVYGVNVRIYDDPEIGPMMVPVSI